MKLGKISQFVSFVVSRSASIRTSFLQSRLCKYTIGVFVLGLLSVSLLSSPISPVDAATTIGTSNTTVVPQGLVGYWTFDGKNMTNATATDMSGWGNNGTLVNTTNAVSASIGKLGQALSFDGVNDYVLTGLTTHYNQTTISAWVYPRSLGEGNLGRIVDKRENGGVETLYFALNGNNKLIFGRKFSTSLIGNWLTLDNSITLNAWNHVIVTFDESSSTNKPVFYINGVLASSTTAYNPTGIATTNTDRYIIGNRGDTTRTFDGKIDDVRIYNRIITPTEVQTLYKAGGGVVTSAVPAKVVSNTGINSDLVGYWTFDRASVSSTTVFDMSSNSTNGTLSNLSQTSLVPGRVGQAINFNGTSSSINLGNGASINITGLITVSAWLKPKANSGSQYVVSKFAGGASNQYLMYVNSSGTTVSFCTGNCNAPNAVSANIPFDKWSHVVGVYDGTNTKIYVNGLFIGNASSPLAPNLSGTNLYLGSNSGASLYKGLMDDVRIYNRALSLSEIKALHKLNQAISAVNIENNNGASINSGLVGYWPFEGKYMTNTTALDASGNGLTGTLTNMTRSSSATIGKVGQGLRFNGAGQFIDLGTPTALDLRTAHSISVWVKTNVLDTTQTIFGTGIQGCCGVESLLELNYNGGGGTYRPRYFHSSYTSLDANPPNFKANTWYHIVVTWDGTGTQKMYINGVLNSSGALTGIGSFGDIAYIGATAGGGNSFNGIIDELRVYSREITSSEVQALYKIGGGR